MVTNLNLIEKKINDEKCKECFFHPNNGVCGGGDGGLMRTDSYDLRLAIGYSYVQPFEYRLRLDTDHVYQVRNGAPKNRNELLHNFLFRKKIDIYYLNLK
jgi:hypothetical protein